VASLFVRTALYARAARATGRGVASTFALTPDLYGSVLLFVALPRLVSRFDDGGAEYRALRVLELNGYSVGRRTPDRKPLVSLCVRAVRVGPCQCSAITAAT